MTEAKNYKMFNEPRFHACIKVMVNPSRKFVVTDRHDGFEIFDKKKRLTNNHKGDIV